jgi:hypothetical protein
LGNDTVKDYLRVHSFNEKTYFNKERYEYLVRFLVSRSVLIDVMTAKKKPITRADAVTALLDHASRADYHFDRLVQYLSPPEVQPKAQSRKKKSRKDS